MQFEQRRKMSHQDKRCILSSHSDRLPITRLSVPIIVVVAVMTTASCAKPVGLKPSGPAAEASQLTLGSKPPGSPTALPGPSIAPVTPCVPLGPEAKGSISVKVNAQILAAIRRLGSNAVFFTSRACPLRVFTDIRVTGDEVGIWGVEWMDGMTGVLRAAGVEPGAGGKGLLRLLGDANFHDLFLSTPQLRLFLTHIYDDRSEQAIVDHGGGIAVQFYETDAASAEPSTPSALEAGARPGW